MKKSFIHTRLLTGAIMALLTFTSAAGTHAQQEKPFDYHSVRGRKAAVSNRDIHEGESHLKMQGKSRPQRMNNFKGKWSGDSHLLWDGLVGDKMQTAFHVEQGGRYQLLIQLTLAPDYGIFAVKLNNIEIRRAVDLFSPKVELAPMLNLGEVTLKSGEQKLTFTLTGGNPKAKRFRGKGYLMGLDYLKLIRLDTPAKSDPKTTPNKTKPEKIKPTPAATHVTLQQMRPVMAQYCFRCHGGEKTKGKVNLKNLTTKQEFLSDIKLTRKIAKALDLHEMPPEKQKQPPKAEYQQLASLFQSYVDEYLRTSSTLPPIVMRRFNRYEYNNAVRDLLQLKGDIYPLPEKTIRAAKPYFNPASGRFPDSVQVSNRTLGKNQVEMQILTGVDPFAIDLQSEHGFNNRGDELSVSPILLESFLKLGHSIVQSRQFDGYCGLSSSLFTAPKNLSTLEQIQLAEKRLRPFLERAFRGPVDEETLDRYIQFFSRQLKSGHSFSPSMKKLVAAILASPRFLYITERKHDAKAEEALTGYELATRLSLFIWSSIPDQALLEQARNGQLLKTDILESQIRRMLADPRSQALSANFARQWLRLDQLITAVPDFKRFPQYYSRIGCEQWKFGLQTMLEPLLLFESIMVEDRSIMLLIDCNYSYRSDELHSWYGSDKPFGNKGNRNRFNTKVQNFKRRSLSTRRQGGVITSAAALTMTSSPLRTNPITRGAWVATVIFNQPPPPPPDTVPEIEADDEAIEAKGLTLRQRLKQHQAKESCAGCHSKIDPLGFALENYDAIGRWREKYRTGLEIDSSGKLFGQTEFTDVIGFKDAILKHPDRFMRGFSEHLLSYALGRELQITDKPAVDRILRRVMADRGQFSTVVLQVAMSYPFLHKTGQREAKP